MFGHMSLLDALRRWRRDETGAPPPTDRQRRRIPDPAAVPTARGTWEEAALTNVDITELVKRELGTVTPPWKK